MNRKLRSSPIFFILVLAVVLPLCAACGRAAPEGSAGAGRTFYVSASGSDEGDGSEAAPFATLSAARDAIRALKSGEGLPDGGVCVLLASGTYPLTESFLLEAADSGEAGKPVVYRAAEGAEVRISGGVTLSPDAFVPASDAVRARLQTEDAKANVLEIDLAAAGCFDLDDSEAYSGGWSSSVYRQELYVGSERQTVARWPNGEYAFSDVNKIEDTTIFLEIPAEKAAAWAGVENIRYFGYPEFDWSTAFFCGANYVLPERSELALVGTAGVHKIGMPYYLFNILEELDAPGEYYFDVPAKKLYYYPGDGYRDREIIFSQLHDAIIRLDGADYVTFDGLTIECGRSYAIQGKSDHITVENCTVRNVVGLHAIQLDCHDGLIRNNELYNLAGGGITVYDSVSGIYFSGDQEKNYATDASRLVPSASLITNNHIHDWSQVYTVYNPAITAARNAVTVSHNEIHDSTHQAIQISAQDVTVEYNEVYRVCSETSDVCAICSGRRFDWRNIVVRYNYVHDIIDTMHGGTPGGIYMDDCEAGVSIYGNLLVNIAGCALAISGGRDITLENNIMVETNNISFDDRGISWGPFASYVEDSYMWQNLLAHPIHSKIWVYRFPQNILMAEVSSSKTENIDDPGAPSYALIRSNIAYKCRNATFLQAAEIEQGMTFEGRLYPDGGIANLNPVVMTNGTVTDNAVYTEDPGFVDAAGGDYRLKPDSRVFRDIIGFEDIPFDRIGRLPS